MKSVNKWQQYSALIAAILLTLSLATLAVWKYRSFDPARDMAFQTLELRLTIDRLEVSLGDSQPTGQITKRYLNHLAAIQKRCQTIKHDSTKAKDDHGSPLLASFTATNSLCMDLVALSKDSGSAYQALLPLLGIDAHLKRYQTLPGMQSVTQSDHQRKVTTSLQALGQSSLAENGFPSAVSSLVSELDKTIQTSSNLSYLPALAHAQAQLLAERQQYWAAYGSLSDLKRELNVQIKRYCVQLELSKSSAVCTSN